MSEQESAAPIADTLQAETATSPVEDSFGDALRAYERNEGHRTSDNKQLRGLVVSVTADAVYVDIGYKTEGVLPLTAFNTEPPKSGDHLLVSVKGRNEEGYYELSKLKVEQPKDWESLEEAFAAQSTISGTVTGIVKGGFTVDVGVRAFLPASRSGTRSAEETEQFVGQSIECRITSLDVADENVIVDRRAVLEEAERSTKDRRFGEVTEGAIVSGTVRSLTSYGAFLDLGGVDGLLHIGEISWSRVEKSEDHLTVGDTFDVQILKIDPATKRIALSRKQLLPHPWDTIADKYTQGQRVRGTVTRTADFGAFVELEPGIEGMVHVSEMSWAKKVRTAADMVKLGDSVDVVILHIDQPARRMALGLKQALGDPWIEAAERLSAGSVVEGPVTSFTKFGAFIQIVEGVEGMVHISEITAEKRLNHPQDVLRMGQRVQAKVLEFDKEKRQLRLSIKQMIPTGLEDFLAEHHVGDTVTGRLVSITQAELGEGILAECRAVSKPEPTPEPSTATLDLSSLTSLLNAKWKTGGTSKAATEVEPARAGQICSFRIVELDPTSKKIVVELA